MPGAKKAKNDQRGEGNREQNGFFETGSKIKRTMARDGPPSIGLVAHSVQEHCGHLRSTRQWLMRRWSMGWRTRGRPPRPTLYVTYASAPRVIFSARHRLPHVSKTDDSSKV